jgi:hypothetical protein
LADAAEAAVNEAHLFPRLALCRNIAFLIVLLTEELTEDQGGEDEVDGLHVLPLPAEPLPENIYGLVIGSLIKDSSDTRLHGPIKLTRIGANFLLYLAMFSLQVFLVAKTKLLVTPEQVKNARVKYGIFESVMYTDGAGVSHVYNTSNGYPRGISPAYFNASNFDKLSADHKDEICKVPLSNVPFLFAVLFIWIITVLREIRDCINLTIRVLC